MFYSNLFHMFDYPNEEVNTRKAHGIQKLTENDDSGSQNQNAGLKSLPLPDCHESTRELMEENPKAKQDNKMTMPITVRVDNSANLITVQQELQRVIEDSSKHGISVSAIVNAVKSEQEAILMLLESLQGFLSTKSCGGQQCVYAHKLTKGVVDSTDKLLASIHESVLCQSETLKASYYKLNKHIIQTLSFIRSDCTLDDILREDEISNNNMENVATNEKEESRIQPNEIDEQLKDSKLLWTVQELKKQLKETRMEFECLKLEKDQEHLEFNMFKETSGKLQTELDTYQRRHADIQTQLVSLQSENDNLRETNERLARLENLTYQVQLHYDVKGELILQVVDELKSLLVQQMGIQRRELMFIHCSSVSDVDPGIPLMVLCVNVSTLSTDVRRIIPSLKASNRVALLILHHKESHALPHQASGRVLGSLEVRSLKQIFDLAFLKEKGLYRCDINKQAVDGIANFIKTNY